MKQITLDEKSFIHDYGFLTITDVTLDEFNGYRVGDIIPIKQKTNKTRNVIVKSISDCSVTLLNYNPLMIAHKNKQRSQSKINSKNSRWS